MHIVVTSGNTAVDIDRVRCITNIFSGRTGAKIALEARARGHRVTLLASRPEVVREVSAKPPEEGGGFRVVSYRTFEELETRLAGSLRGGGVGALVHSAAVSDYASSGIYAAAPGVEFDPAAGAFRAPAGEPASLVDISAGKVKSDHPEVWIRMTRLPKLVDHVRAWGFSGLLVKFKLEVGLSDEELLAVAERSRLVSHASLMVANTLEGASSFAFLGPFAGAYERVSREQLPARLLDAIEAAAPSV